MDKCKYCGADTELYVAGVPMCIECSREAERQAKVGDIRKSSLDSRPKDEQKRVG